MQQKNLLNLLIGLFLFFPFFSSISCGEEAKTVKLAILPCTDVVKTYERFKPLTAYLEKETGLAVKNVFPQNEEELIRLFRQRNVDFIFHSPYGFSKFKDIIDPQSLLKSLGPDGKDHEIGYIVVRKESGLKTFQDLKGKTVLFGMECSAGRRMAAKKIFLKNGIDVERIWGDITMAGVVKISVLMFFSRWPTPA